MGEFKFSFFIMSIFLGIVSLGLVNMVFNLNRLFLGLELIFLLMVLLFTFISMIAIYNNVKWGWVFLSYILGFVLVDILFIHYMRGRPEFFFTTTIFALMGFLISLVKAQKDEEPEDFESQEDEEPVNKEFQPGKYVASKNAGTYHAPKCDWAKRIKKSNQIWLSDEKEAKKKGYKAHSCLKIYKNF